MVVDSMQINTHIPVRCKDKAHKSTSQIVIYSINHGETSIAKCSRKMLSKYGCASVSVIIGALLDTLCDHFSDALITTMYG